MTHLLKNELQFFLNYGALTGDQACGLKHTKHASGTTSLQGACLCICA